MNSEIVAALIGATVPTIIAIFAYLQWRRDFELQARRLTEGITSEVIRQRIQPYADFMQELKSGSSIHNTVEELSEDELDALLDALQNAIYGSVGLLATHETRQLILHARDGCLRFRQGTLSHNLLMYRFWSLHLSLRSDLGISQPKWESAVDKLQQGAKIDEQAIWGELPAYYPWDDLQELHRFSEKDNR